MQDRNTADVPASWMRCSNRTQLWPCLLFWEWLLQDPFDYNQGRTQTTVEKSLMKYYDQAWENSWYSLSKAHSRLHYIATMLCCLWWRTRMSTRECHVPSRQCKSTWQWKLELFSSMWKHITSQDHVIFSACLSLHWRAKIKFANLNVKQAPHLFSSSPKFELPRESRPGK